MYVICGDKQNKKANGWSTQGMRDEGTVVIKYLILICRVTILVWIKRLGWFGFTVHNIVGTRYCWRWPSWLLRSQMAPTVRKAASVSGPAAAPKLAGYQPRRGQVRKIFWIKKWSNFFDIDLCNDTDQEWFSSDKGHPIEKLLKRAAEKLACI